MIRWLKVFKYALAIYASQFFTGFVEGLLLPASAGNLLSPQSIASLAVSLFLCTAVFAHLALNQADRPIEHGSLAIVVQLAVGALVTLATPPWLATTSAAEIGVELLVLVAALFAGTWLATRRRKRHAGRAEA